MAQGTDATILAALLDHLGTLSFTPALQIAMPGIDFPAAGQAKPDNYLQAAFLPNDTTNTELGAGQEQHRGILQVSVYWKKGVGHIKPLEAANRIINHFAKGTTLHKDGLKIVIDRKPYAASPLQETDRVQVPVTVRYHAFA
ncbi:phage tail terminator-like protein [Shinella oryzae]|uniref:Phage tail terminator-like protein n=1 Tax=Shinella oryzae TaxID=2871820 RepID=A0ABY9K2H7_9HYPH|nr:phage tail terminator-like protein [Shinella oryzae]WLS01744.1 phage tail terminator-like protein [Shinella oryzae]